MRIFLKFPRFLFVGSHVILIIVAYSKNKDFTLNFNNERIIKQMILEKIGILYQKLEIDFQTSEIIFLNFYPLNQF